MSRPLFSGTRRAAAALLAAALLAPPAPAIAEPAARSLLMVERPGCEWCARWNAEVAPAYPNTPEGARAPLARVLLSRVAEAGVAFSRPVRYTPTFVLVEDGAEVGRIEGYPGADFFWPMLEGLLAEADAAAAGR